MRSGVPKAWGPAPAASPSSLNPSATPGAGPGRARAGLMPAELTGCREHRAREQRPSGGGPRVPLSSGRRRRRRRRFWCPRGGDTSQEGPGLNRLGGLAGPGTTETRGGRPCRRKAAWAALGERHACRPVPVGPSEAASGDGGEPVLQERPGGFHCLRLHAQWFSVEAHYYLCAKHLWPARPPPYSPKEPPAAGSAFYPDPVCPGLLKPRGQLAFLGDCGRLTHGGEVMPANTQRRRAHAHAHAHACTRAHTCTSPAWGLRPGTGGGGWGWVP